MTTGYVEVAGLSPAGRRRGCPATNGRETAEVREGVAGLSECVREVRCERGAVDVPRLPAVAPIEAVS